MAELQATLTGFLPFIIFFALAIAQLSLFMWVYTKATPYDEVALVKENNVAAALTFGGAVLGFVIPLGSALTESFSVIQFGVWGLIAGSVQLLVFAAYRRVYPRIAERVENAEIASALKLAFVSIAVGILNSAALVE